MAGKKKVTEKKVGFFQRLMDKFDAKLEKKSKAKKCSCCDGKSGKKKC